MSSISLNPSRKLVSFYQEILLNELAIMRSNELLFYGVPSLRGVYYVSYFVPMVKTSNPLRSLDVVGLVYAIYNGVRKISCSNQCTYEIDQPAKWSSGCNIVRMLENFMKHINRISVKKIHVQRYNDNIKYLIELTSNIVAWLIDVGLVHLIIYRKDENNSFNKEIIQHLEYMEKIVNITSNPSWNPANRVITVNTLKDIVALRNSSILLDFFREVLSTVVNSGRISERDVVQFLKHLAEEVVKKIGLNTMFAESDVQEKLERGNIGYAFKTMHGDLMRMIYDARALPNTLTNYEGRILPFLAEPNPLDISPIDISELKDLLIQYLRMHGVSENNAIKIADSFIKALKKNGYEKLSRYQYRYLEKMLLNISGNGVKAVLTAPTGSGKTLIFTIYSILRILKDKTTGNGCSAIFIYPRKALASDQLQKLVNLIYELNQNLPQDLRICIGIRDNDSLEFKNTNKDRQISLRGLKINGVELKHQFTRDNEYRVYLGNKTVYFIRDHKEGGASSTVYSCDILVTNHSMIGKHLTEYLKNEMKNPLKREFIDFIDKLKIVVIDEAHMYLRSRENSLIQGVLFKLYITKNFLTGSKIPDIYKELDIIFSSATLTNKDLFKSPNGKIPPEHVIGIVLMPKTHGTNKEEIPGEIIEFFEKISLKPREVDPEILYIDYYSTLAVEDNKGGKTYCLKEPYKLRISMLVNTYPYKSGWTSLNESLIAVLHWIHAVRSRIGLNLSSLVFVDSRETLKSIFSYFRRRQILEACDHSDRVLLTNLFSRSYIKRDKNKIGVKRIQALEHIVSKVTRFYNIGAGNNVLYTIFDLYPNTSDYFSRFHVLTFYLDRARLRKLDKYYKTIDDFSKIMIDSFKEAYTFASDLIAYTLHINGNTKHFRQIEVSKRILKYIREYIKRGKTAYYVVHHGELDQEYRKTIEELIRSKVKYSPYIVLSTSTLEVGVDIPSIAFTIQYGTDALPQEVQQRFGRSGRDLYSFYTSTGILIMRNTGEDLYYSSEEKAVEYIYSLSLKIPRSIFEDIDEIARHILSFTSISNPELDEILELLPYFTDRFDNEEQRKELKRYLNSWIKNYNRIIELKSEDTLSFDPRKELRENINSMKYPIELLLRQDVFQEKDSNLKRILEQIANTAIRYSTPYDIVESIMIISTLIEKLREELFKVDPSKIQYRGDIYDILSRLEDIQWKLFLLLRKYEQIIFPNPSTTGRKSTLLDIIAKTTIPPGIINPVSYDEDIYMLFKLDIGSNGRGYLRPPKKRQGIEYLDLTKRARPLHTRD